MQFEFQIEELENKIAELEKFAKEKEVDLSDEINKLEDQRKIALKVLYDDLTDYQRVMVSRHPERPYTPRRGALSANRRRPGCCLSHLERRGTHS